MELKDILSLRRTRCKLKATSKKKALEEIASIISSEFPQLLENDIFEHLIDREKKGSTAIGHGIAIPHCRMKNCHQVLGGLFHLDQSIDFNALDGESVNLLFVLIVPEDEANKHLETLAVLSRKLDSETFRKELLSAESDLSLFHHATA